jgi:hypothetical protein
MSPAAKPLKALESVSIAVLLVPRYLGGAKRTPGRPGWAAEVLGPARVVLERLGATPLLTELEALARQAWLALGVGAQPGRTARVDGYELTSRERQVLGLLAAGRSNPQIAGGRPGWTDN